MGYETMPNKSSEIGSQSRWNRAIIAPIHFSSGRVRKLARHRDDATQETRNDSLHAARPRGDFAAPSRKRAATDYPAAASGLWQKPPPRLWPAATSPLALVAHAYGSVQRRFQRCGGATTSPGASARGNVNVSEGDGRTGHEKSAWDRCELRHTYR